MMAKWKQNRQCNMCVTVAYTSCSVLAVYCSSGGLFQRLRNLLGTTPNSLFILAIQELEDGVNTGVWRPLMVPVT